MLVLVNRGLTPFKASASTLVGSRMLGIVRGVTGMVTTQYQKTRAVPGVSDDLQSMSRCPILRVKT